MLYLTDLGINNAQIYQDADEYAFSQDSVFLANLAKLGPKDNLLDLGCGTGVLSVLAMLKKGVKSAIGIDIRAHAVEIANMNADRNGLDFKAIVGDVVNIKELIVAESFDKVICNPPYFAVSHSASADKAIARGESGASLSDFVSAAAYALKFGGELTIIMKLDRLAPLFEALCACKLQPKHIVFIYPKLSLGVDAVVIRAKKGGRVGLTSSTLIAQNEDGSFTAAYKELYS